MSKDTRKHKPSGIKVFTSELERLEIFFFLLSSFVLMGLIYFHPFNLAELKTSLDKSSATSTCFCRALHKEKYSCSMMGLRWLKMLLLIVSCRWAAPQLLITKNEKKLSVRWVSLCRRDGACRWRKRETKSCLGSKCCAEANLETLGMAYVHSMAAVHYKTK